MNLERRMTHLLLQILVAVSPDEVIVVGGYVRMKMMATTTL